MQSRAGPYKVRSTLAKRDTQTFVVVHVDDFLCVGPWDELDLLHASPKKVCDLKSTMLRGRVQQVKYSNKAIRRKEGCISWESDPKHLMA